MFYESNFMSKDCFWFGVVVLGMAMPTFTPARAADGVLGTVPSGSPHVRELEADRPDATESPVTVDQGYFQVESSFFSFSTDKQGGTRVKTYTVAETNVKYGLLDNLDLQLVFSPYIKETTETAGVRTHVDDFSDIVMRLKYNFWGNDGGSTALGIMPFVKIPTQTDVSNGRWEGGLIVPFAWRAGERWGLGFQGEIDRVYNEDNHEMDWDFAHTAVLGFDLTERIGIYLEYLGVAGAHPYESYFSGGATYSLNDCIQLDAGTLVGLSDEAEDLTVFSGISFKF